MRLVMRMKSMILITRIGGRMRMRMKLDDKEDGVDNGEGNFY